MRSEGCCTVESKKYEEVEEARVEEVRVGAAVGDGEVDVYVSFRSLG